MALCASVFCYSKCKVMKGRYCLLNIYEVKSASSEAYKRNKFLTAITKAGLRETFFEG